MCGPTSRHRRTDDRDAEAIAEAATRPTMRFVTLKSEAQLDMQTLHRVRDQLVGERTALMNQIRAVLLERGHIVPQGRAKLAAMLGKSCSIPTAVSDLTPRMRMPGGGCPGTLAVPRWAHRSTRCTEFAEQGSDRRERSPAHHHPGHRRTQCHERWSRRSAMSATFARGRDLAAWLGLVPRQVTTGGRPRLLGITKRGSKYLRKMLIQGARAAMPTLRKSETLIGQWLRGLLARAHANTAVVALAAKMARTVWALLRHERVYEPAAVAA